MLQYIQLSYTVYIIILVAWVVSPVRNENSRLPFATVENRKTRIRVFRPQCVKPATSRFPEQVGNRQREAGQIFVGAVHSLRTCVCVCVCFFVGSSTYDRAIGLQSRLDLSSR